MFALNYRLTSAISSVPLSAASRRCGRITMLLLGLAFGASALADANRQTKGEYYDAFRQLGVDLPTPNDYRAASGAPGSRYWQQRADYDISVSLDEAKQQISGSEKVTYANQSPDTLRYLWFQLDQNRFREDSIEQRGQTAANPAYVPQYEGADLLTFGTLARHQSIAADDYGHRISKVADASGQPLEHVINGTMMRIDLPEPLISGASITLQIDWAYNIVDEARVGSRGGYEYFEEGDEYIFFLAQWFPRLAAYTDYTGWQHKAFIGRGEFTLEFGDYKVAITVPEDHIVSATGVLLNESEVLSTEQQQRLDKARKSDVPVFIVTPEEAKENETEGTDKTSTWVFEAKNVRDFAWSSSRKFIWDAMIHKQSDPAVPEVLAMSFYPNEAEPIWSKYSTEAVVHTMEVYSRLSFPYPYPTAQSVNAWERGGMEYPMITFNGYRPEPYEPAEEECDPCEDDMAEEATTAGEGGDVYPENTYSRRVKYGLIGVIIHEIGHIYFPMTVNSDERRWTWMDEGINSFLEYLAELEWEENFPAYRPNTSPLEYITAYMTSENQVPIMTQSDSVLQFGNNAYSKPTAALTVLRETVMGRELFDFAFREYARRWRFKRPTPADFFRTMEDASGVDLDWFWRGWFYSTDHVDVAITDVRSYQISTLDPDVEYPLQRQENARDVPEPLEQLRNEEEQRPYRLERRKQLGDFYNENDRFTVSNQDRNLYQEYLESLEDWEQATLAKALEAGHYYTFIDFENLGGLVTPLPLTVRLADGSESELMIPAEIWRRNHLTVTKMLVTEQPVASVEVDVAHQTADANFRNNRFPQTIHKSRLALYKFEDEDRDLMAAMLEKLREHGEETPADSKAVPLDAVQ
ncbi:MAG: M1 family metallopeptidase [Pseudomonadota bacterium]